MLQALNVTTDCDVGHIKKLTLEPTLAPESLGLEGALPGFDPSDAIQTP